MRPQLLCNLTIAETSGRTGVPEATLYLWRNRARVAGRVVPDDGSNLEDWSAEDKLRVVVETMLVHGGFVGANFNTVSILRCR